MSLFLRYYKYWSRVLPLPTQAAGPFGKRFVKAQAPAVLRDMAKSFYVFATQCNFFYIFVYSIFTKRIRTNLDNIDEYRI
jgi:hypothetical protein